MSKVLFSLVIVSCLILAVSCDGSTTATTPNTSSLGIYLVDTGETVLSDREIKAYRNSDNSFELNEAGIKKWNAHIPYQTPPRLEGTLFTREFVLKIDGREICRGKFWSGVSSASEEGIVITDALFVMDTSHNILRINSGYPAALGSLDASVSAELARFFESRNLPG